MVSRAPVFQKLLIATLAVFWLALPALAEEEGHLRGPFGEFLAHCPFAHGYLHGYEEGYHLGDGDFHLGRERDSHAVLQQKTTDGYRIAFGDHSSYRYGYREGVKAGYNDSIQGREFRAYDELRVYQPASEALSFSDVDRGYANGYGLGYRNGLQSVESGGDFDAEPAPCPARPTADGTLPAQSVAYCDGWAKAYAIGYRDAYLSREMTATQVAAKK